MKYEVVNLEEKTLVGIGVRTTNENMKAMEDIGIVWGRFIGEDIIGTIKNRVNEMAIGLYTEYEGDFTKPYKFYAGVEVEKVHDLNRGLEVKTINGGKYAKFTVKGHMQQAVGEAWGKIWEMDLDRKYDCDFEIYHNDSEDMNNQTIDIYIALK